jgi:hypothetical protein
MHPKEVLPKKPIFLGLFTWQESIFFSKTFVGALFSCIKFTLLKSVCKDGFFDNPFAIFKEKKF